MGGRRHFSLTDIESEYEYRGDADAANVGDIVTNIYGIQNSGDATLSHLELTGAEVGHCVRYSVLCCVVMPLSIFVCRHNTLPLPPDVRLTLSYIVTMIVNSLLTTQK